MKIAVFAAAAMACATPVMADPAASPAAKVAMPAATVGPAAPPAASAPSACCHLAAGTVVNIALVEPVGSHEQKTGDQFAICLSDPILVDGMVVIPAGARGLGEVVDATPAAYGGQPGKLILAARYIDYGGARISLRAFKLSGSGATNLGARTAVALFVSPLLAMTISGNNIEYQAGTRALAKVAADVTLAPLAVQPPVQPH